MRYFDFNATTPLAPFVEEAWVQANRDYWHNPSSPYASSARARNFLESLRERLASYLGCSASSIVFNSGATEGNNAVIQYVARKSLPHSRILISAIEHPCVMQAADDAFGRKVDIIPVSNNGLIEITELPALLKNGKLPIGFGNGRK